MNKNEHTIVEVMVNNSSEEELARVMKEVMEESFNCTVMEMDVVSSDEITVKVRCNQTGIYYIIGGIKESDLR
jgi:ABC-type proline/glycine betaine transport system substrate-binding protein